MITRSSAWTNVEDEILRAAVAKYGLNQWARVSSLLARKSAAQCKARWNEWLDPSIDRAPWTPDLDDKLLHLARIMPNRWRSIGSMLGRTGAQVAERYKFLISRNSGGAQQSLPGPRAGEEQTTSFHDESLGGLGGTDAYNADSKAAKPDTVDMDDDELEMLAEARARLANTKGRKSKRKEREKYLDQKGRLELIEQRRQVLSGQTESGLARAPELRFKRSKFSVDYNAAIPFQIEVPSGPYDTKVEVGESEKLRELFHRSVLAEGRHFGQSIPSKPTEDVDDLLEQARLDAVQERAYKEHRDRRPALDLPSPVNVGDSPVSSPRQSDPELADLIARRFKELPEPKASGKVEIPVSKPAYEGAGPQTESSADSENGKESETAGRVAHEPALDLEADIQSRAATSARLGLPVATRVVLLPWADVLDEDVFDMVSGSTVAVLPAASDQALALALIDSELAAMDPPLDENGDLWTPSAPVPAFIRNDPMLLGKLRARITQDQGPLLTRHNELISKFRDLCIESEQISEQMSSLEALSRWEANGVVAREDALRSQLEHVSRAAQSVTDRIRPLIAQE